jgi:hypothetical protein
MRSERKVVEGAIWLAPEQAAARLSIGRTGLYDLIRKGRNGEPGGLASVKLNGRTFIPSAALVEFTRDVEAEQLGRAITPPVVATADT